MAPPDHLALLQWREVEQWNKWREREPEVQPDLSKAYLVWANLRETDLAEVDLSGANLHGANLIRANLSEAHLRGANLYGAALSDARLDGTDLRGIPWQDVHYDRAGEGDAAPREQDGKNEERDGTS